MMKHDEWLKPGDCVVINGWWYEISAIYDEQKHDGVWEVEFLDENGSYHFWNSKEENGYVVRKDESYSVFSC